MDKGEERRKKYLQVLRAAKAFAEPDVVIWGPGRTRTDYEKRERVRKAILAEVPYAGVTFPEDLHVQEASEDTTRTNDLQVNELLQATAADIIIALDLSPAVGEEIAHFSAFPKIANKLFVVAVEDRISEYQKAVRDQVRVEFVTSDEIATCQKTTQLCIDHISKWCLWKYAEAA